MRRFWIDPQQLASLTPMLTGPEVKHARNVLRLKVNDPILVFDGNGTTYQAVIVSMQDDRIRIDIQQEHSAPSESPLVLIVSLAMLKGQKMDELIRPLTELGMTSWMPFQAERSVPVLDQERINRRVQRWRKIALESMKQCGRQQCPDIFPPATLAQIIQHADNHQLKLFFWEKAFGQLKDCFRLNSTTDFSGVHLIIGPEGGFSSHEANYAASGGFHQVSLGPRILKSETAAIAVCALVQHFLGDL